MLQCNIDNVEGGNVPEVSLDINDLPENIKTKYVINLKTVNSKISNTENKRNTDESNKEIKLNTDVLELTNDVKMEDNPVVLCPIEHISSEIGSELSNKDIHIENNNELKENNSVRQTGMLCNEMEKDICPYDENICKDEVINNKITEIKKEIDICRNDENNLKNDEVSSDNTSDVTSNNVCSKEGSRFKLEVNNVENVHLSAATTSETSDNTLESEINDTVTHKIDSKIIEPEQKVTNDESDQSKTKALNSKVHLECVTGESVEKQHIR